MLSSPEPPVKNRRLNPIKLRQMRQRCQEIELEVARLEAGIAGHEAGLANFTSAEQTQRLMAQLAADRALVDALVAEWEDLSRAIEENQ